MPSASATRMTCGAGSAGRAVRGSPDEQMTLMTDLTFERVVIVHRLIGDLRRMLCGFAKKMVEEVGGIEPPGHIEHLATE